MWEWQGWRAELSFALLFVLAASLAFASGCAVGGSIPLGGAGLGIGAPVHLESDVGRDADGRYTASASAVENGSGVPIIDARFRLNLPAFIRTAGVALGGYLPDWATSLFSVSGEFDPAPPRVAPLAAPPPPPEAVPPPPESVISAGG